MAYDVAALDGAQKQVAAIRLLERLRLSGTAAERAIAWVAAGKDPAAFGTPSSGGNGKVGKASKPPWDPKIPDDGVAAHAPDFLSVRAAPGGMADVSFRVPDHMAAVIADAGLAAYDDVLGKEGDPASPHHAAYPALVKAAAAAEATKGRERAERERAKDEPRRQALAQLTRVRQERDRLGQEIATRLAALIGQGPMYVRALATSTSGNAKKASEALRHLAAVHGADGADGFKAVIDLAAQHAKAVD